MRLAAPFLLLAVLHVAALAAGAPEPPNPHAPNVVDVHHLPANVQLDDDVTVHLELRDGTGVDRVFLEHCRAEGYRCAPRTLMTPHDAVNWTGRIPWDDEFYAGARNIGYRIQIHYTNGTVESTPLENFPDRPSSLPEGASTYYFFQLPPGPAARSSGASTTGLLVAAALAGTLLHRGQRGAP